MSLELGSFTSHITFKKVFSSYASVLFTLYGKAIYMKFVRNDSPPSITGLHSTLQIQRIEKYSYIHYMKVERLSKINFGIQKPLYVAKL